MTNETLVSLNLFFRNDSGSLERPSQKGSNQLTAMNYSEHGNPSFFTGISTGISSGISTECGTKSNAGGFANNTLKGMQNFEDKRCAKRIHNSDNCANQNTESQFI